MTFEEIIQAIGKKPYYQDDAVVIYHADCRDILPLIPDKSIDLVLTDPPYGINYKHSGKGAAVFSRRFKSAQHHSEKVINDDKPFDPTPFLNFPEVILWGANNFCHLLPERTGRWLIWDKADGRYNIDSFGDVELGWCNKGRAARLFRYAWKGVYCVKKGENNGYRYHPTMKPLGLMKWCIQSIAISKGIIFEPFMGSGTTLVAAKQLGRKCIGIEIEEKYCEIATKRCSQGVFKLEIPQIKSSLPQPLLPDKDGFTYY